MENRWQMHRAGLLNFWYYEEETFDFTDGKLLLRGSNGSGKSVTMQSFLPVLLDANKSPIRLDPFGSRSRKMEDYLLGEKEISQWDERTGYLFIEYKKAHTDQYVTTGIGMQAKRGKSMNSWGFVITDNRRLQFDMDLYNWEQQGNEKVRVPLSKKQLLNRIGTGGEVVDRNEDYMELVRKHVFGFETKEAYQDLIELLIQLRSPKLSKDYRPTVIYEILEQALPPIQDSDLQHLSDVIEQMDQTKLQIEQLEREVKAIGKIKKVYDEYNQRILYDQLVEWDLVAKELKTERVKLKETLHIKKETEIHVADIEEQLRTININMDTQKQLNESLNAHHIWGLEKQRKQQADQVEWLAKRLKQLEDKQEGLKQKERSKQQTIEQQIERMVTLASSINSLIEDIEYEAEESGFNRHGQNVTDFERHRRGEYTFDVWKQEAAVHRKHLIDSLDQMRKVEHLRQTIADKRIETGKLEQDRDQKEAELSGWRNLFSEEKARYLERIHSWVGNHKQYDIEPTTIQQSSRRLDMLFESYQPDQVKAVFRPAVEGYDQQLLAALSKLDATREDLRDKRASKEVDLKKWKQKKDPEPNRDERTKASREQMEEAHAAFFEVVEFRDGVPEAVRALVESALQDAGLLDALIAAPGTSAVHDRVLVSNPQELAYTLTDILRPDPEQQLVPEAWVQEALQSILVGVTGEESGSASITEGGNYRIGPISGHALPSESAKFIGRESRKRYREQLIRDLEAELESMDKLVAELSASQDDLTEKLNASRIAWDGFPGSEDAWESYRQTDRFQNLISDLNVRMEILVSELSVFHVEHQQEKHALHLLTDGIAIEASRDVYSDAITHMESYVSKLEELHRTDQELRSKQSQLDAWERELEEIVEESLEAAGEFNVTDIEWRTQKGLLEEQDRHLAKEGADDVRAQILEVRNRLAELSRLDKEKREAKPGILADLRRFEDKEQELMRSISFLSKLEESWVRALELEVGRGLVKVAEPINALSDWFSVLSVKENRSISLLEQLLSKAFAESEREITEYRMSEHVLQMEPEAWMDEELDSRFRPSVEIWKSKTSRRLIDTDKRGVRVSPNSLFAELSQDLLEQENRLSLQDEELYREILFNSVGRRIRALITRGEKWTDKMRQIMEDSDSSSGLKFSIKWKPKTADNDSELDTRELVALLRKDQTLLREEDMASISSHFRSKIEGAKRWVEEKGDGQTLLQVLKLVLDYRKWFQFELYYEKPNEPRRELTNHHFFKFSGGEKAMAMYIPLFTACYSRYQEAANFAPYIVSLDEAFAGVDERNINEMFEIVEKLGFNYIMNSQVLWGDYAAVRGLSICELVRPQNANYVTVIRYQWNGRRIEMEGVEQS